ncbi:MAG TPA: signal recognition particle protein [Thermomicrobiales bacterium]|nr:signal recognition particle protein [Thermomicrobiales bacterium]
MFETLSDRLTQSLGKLSRKGNLTEQDVDDAMREVRRALLEADVNFKVAKDFISAVRERAVGQDVLKSLTPSQTVVSIVNEELINILGKEREPLGIPDRPPQIIMLVGLQGSGKTTHAAKLATLLRKEGRLPLLVAADVYRPAAIKQLQTLGRQIDITVYEEGTSANPVDIAQHAIHYAKERGFSTVIVDTAGRLQIDDRMMNEVAQIERTIQPTEVLLVADAMTGQEAVNVAEAFHEKLGITGLILTKMDGDARGGAALSIRAVTGVPIKFIGTGEKLDAMEPFYPQRLASRILGMGDVLSLIERAQEQTTEEDAKDLQARLTKGQFNLDDFLDQIQKIKKMGPLSSLLEMIPGMGQQLRQAKAQISDDDYKRIEAIIYSMTLEERKRPQLIDGRRRRRIARGSGTSREEVSQLIKQFEEMRKMMAQMGNMTKKGRMPKGLQGLPFDFN